MEEARAKRRKISRGEDDYLPGNITEIELHNFMTFSDLVCKPGSRLNLVIGPNGSGKSSLVCAIALGLGGEPSLLGRAINIGAFVKRGEESGYIKISLRGYTKEQKITIVRKIDTRNKSEWLYNGKSVPKREILEIMSNFNIQVNNLTQFLPQDRVCEFAKLTPVQLLEETEKAVGDPQLPLQHHALVERSCELKRYQIAVETMGKSLKQLIDLNAEQEKDVERIRQRNELLEKVDYMKKKLPWLKYDMKKTEYLKAQEKEKDAKKKLDEAAKTLKDLKAPIEKQKQEKAKLDDKCKQIGNLMNENVKKRANLLEKENEAAVQMQSKYRDVKDVREKEDSRKQRILEDKKKLADAEEELLSLPPYKPPEEIERLGNQIVEISSSVREKTQQKKDKEKRLGQLKTALRNCVNSLKDLENTNTKLLHALQNSGAEKIFDAYRWLQAHRKELNKEVFGPVLLEVKVSDQIHANFLEGHVAHYIWKSFITQDSGDRDFLVKNLQPFDVPILNYVRDESGRKQPLEISEQMHELGIYSRLDQIFDAPTAVKEVLTLQFGLDRSYIGSSKTDRNADDVAKLRILDFWTPENHYHWSVSRYSDEALSATVEPVGVSRLLLCGTDVGEIEKLKSRKSELESAVADLEEGLKSLQIEERLLEDEAAKLRKQRDEMVSTGAREKKRRRDLENYVERMKVKLASWKDGDDLETAVAKLIDQAKRYNIERFKHATKIKDLLVEAVSYKWSFAEKHMASIDYDAKIRGLEDNLKKHEKFAQEASLHLQYCKKEVENYHQQLSVAKRHAESIAIITPELTKLFLQMPTTIEELEAAIRDNISQANSIFCLNGNNILLEYEDRRRQIETISEKLEADNNKLQKCMAEIDALKGTWLPALRNLVNQIHETFSRNFQEMAVAGEVSLDEHAADFDQYGILIKVKFRPTGQLQVLSAHHQSGGERSVSTILYLVSLQDLTNCPFRVVDEINQGMDPINERKMFQQLVRAASQVNTPQCFLLTPKLLPNLEYSEACSILNIMNGPWIASPTKVWSSGERWGTIAGLVEESRC